MQTLNIPFDDKEYNELKDAKDRLILSWREFILRKCLDRKTPIDIAKEKLAK